MTLLLKFFSVIFYDIIFCCYILQKVISYFRMIIFQMSIYIFHSFIHSWIYFKNILIDIEMGYGWEIFMLLICLNFNYIQIEINCLILISFQIMINNHPMNSTIPNRTTLPSPFKRNSSLPPSMQPKLQMNFMSSKFILFYLFIYSILFYLIFCYPVFSFKFFINLCVSLTNRK